MTFQARKDFTPSEAVTIGRIIEERHRAKVAELRPSQRRRAGLAAHGIDAVLEKQDAAIGTSRMAAARAVGMSESRYRQARAIVAAAESDPATFGDLPAIEARR